MKIHIDMLYIETTKRCNSKCKHCLRGEPENIDFSNEQYLDNLFCDISSISQLGLTGGEPTLNPDIINIILKYLKKYNITLSYFYIATNGLIYNNIFVKNLFLLYKYCTQPNNCILTVSKDNFHHFNETNYLKFKKLPFFKPLKEAKNKTEEEYPLVKTGRSLNNTINPSSISPFMCFNINNLQVKKQILQIKDNYMIFVDSNGKMFCDINLSYEQMNNNFKCFGTLNTNILELLKNEVKYE